MKNILIAIRSIFKKGRHNVMKIVSLGIGLAVGLVLIAKVYFEQSYDDFYPDRDLSLIHICINNLFFYHILFCYVKSSRGNPCIQVKSADSSVGIDQ